MESAVVVPLFKICSLCKDEKPITEFWRYRKTYQARCKTCSKKTVKEYAYQHYETDKGKIGSRRRELKHNFNMTLEEYDTLLATQKNSCAICNKTPEENKKRLAVDHCHKTNKIRGLLCSLCNTALGALKDDIELLDKAKEYLLRSK